MRRLAEIEAHVATMGELLDIVGAMRSLASMRLQGAQRALPGVRRYAEAMATAVGEALLLMPEPTTGRHTVGGRRALILCTGERGFVGGFNERLLEAVETDRNARDAVFILGSRGATLARERGRPMVWSHPMATRLESVPETILRLTAELYRLIARGDITRAEVIFARYRQGDIPVIERRVLFPIDVASVVARQTRLPPLHNLSPDVLLEKLIAEYIFALVTEAAIESLASENAARLAAMNSAHENVSRKLDELRQEAHRARQSESTMELLDVVTGAEALQGAEAGPLRPLQLFSKGGSRSSAFRVSAPRGRATTALARGDRSVRSRG